jgi:PAS domain-containing protein
MSRKPKVRARQRSDAELREIARHALREAARIAAPCFISIDDDGRIYFWNPHYEAATARRLAVHEGWLAGAFTATCEPGVIRDSLRARLDEIEKAAA